MALAVFAIARSEAATPIDGPYVIRTPGGQLEAWSVEDSPEGPRKRIETLDERPVVTVPAVGKQPAFWVPIRPPARVATDDVTVSSRVPLFVVADTHGEFEILAAMLRAHGVINRRLAWSFGRGHLVLLGDVFDRGQHQTEILWLIYKLEAEARKAGGGTHLIMGNHEAMVLRGDLRYLHAKYGQTAEILGAVSYSELFGSQSVLGQWLRSLPSVFKFDELLCLHGGISRALTDLGIDLTTVNSVVRAALDSQPDMLVDEENYAALLMGKLGPLWYRGYFPGETDFPAATEEDIELSLAQFGVRRILVGHTGVQAVTAMHNGRVVAVHVYPQVDPESGATVFEGLLIRRGRYFRAMPDGSRVRLDSIP